MELIIESFMRLSKTTILFKTTRSISQQCPSLPRQCESEHCHCDNRNIGGNALGGTATPHL